MRLTLLIPFGYLIFAAQPVPTVDLSAFAAEFPTNAVSVTGCQAAYDSPQKEPPASCRPFPITMEVRRERPNVPSDGARALEVVITNTSEREVQIPSSPKEIKGLGKETFVTFRIYSPPGSLRVASISYAFSNTQVASSVVTIGPHESAIYIIPFDRSSFKSQKGSGENKIQIQVELTAYSLERGSKKSDDVSALRTNPILSPPFTLPN